MVISLLDKFELVVLKVMDRVILLLGYNLLSG